MDTVGIVPHQQEVLSCRLHGGYAPDRFFGIYNSRGIGILRNIPHSLDLRVFYELLYDIHVWPFFIHRNRYEFESETLGYTEMSVIPRDRAEEFESFLFRPRRRAVQKPVCKGFCHCIIHEREARVAADEHLLLSASQDIGKESSCLRHAGKLAVVGSIDPVSDHVISLRNERKHGNRKRDLFCLGLASHHIELQSFCFKFVKPALHFCIICHYFKPSKHLSVL